MSDLEKAVHAAVEKWRKERMPEYISTTDQMRLEAHLRTALSALGGWEPTHQHRKGGLYRVIARGKLEADLSPVVVYEAKDGTTWVRPEAEFDDGRFTALRRPAPGGG